MPRKKNWKHKEDIIIRKRGNKSITIGEDNTIKCPNNYELNIETQRGNKYTLQKYNQDKLKIMLNEGVCTLMVQNIPIGEIRYENGEVQFKLRKKGIIDPDNKHLVHFKKKPSKKKR